MGSRCQPIQVAAIRVWLQRTKRSESEILEHNSIGRLEELSVGLADQLVRQLMELGRERPR